MGPEELALVEHPGEDAAQPVLVEQREQVAGRRAGRSARPLTAAATAGVPPDELPRQLDELGVAGPLSAGSYDGRRGQREQPDQ